LPRETRVLRVANSEDFAILACTVLIGLKGVTKQRRTSRHARLRRAKHHMLSRVKKLLGYVCATP